MGDETMKSIVGSSIFKNAIGEYLKENLKISIDITGYYDHIIEINLLLDGKVIDTDSVMVNRWTAGY